MEIFSSAIQSPLEKRQYKFLESVVQELNEHSEKIDDLKIENLVENEAFITVAMRATQAALKNHQEEKLAALRSAVINTALGTGSDDNLQLMFLQMVDELTPMHLKVLSIGKDPGKYAEDHGVSLKRSVSGSRYETFTTILGEECPPYPSQVMADLHSRGLTNISPNSLKAMASETGEITPRTHLTRTCS